MLKEITQNFNIFLVDNSLIASHFRHFLPIYVYNVQIQAFSRLFHIYSCKNTIRNP